MKRNIKSYECRAEYRVFSDNKYTRLVHISTDGKDVDEADKVADSLFWRLRSIEWNPNTEEYYSSSSMSFTVEVDIVGSMNGVPSVGILDALGEIKIEGPKGIYFNFYRVRELFQKGSSLGKFKVWS